jgi:hypothetical protein
MKFNFNTLDTTRINVACQATDVDKFVKTNLSTVYRTKKHLKWVKMFLS